MRALFKEKVISRIYNILFTMILVSFCGFISSLHAEEMSHILIISSYNPDTRQTTATISDFLEEYKQLGGTLPLTIKNMNCKSLPDAPQWKTNMKHILEEFSGEKAPELIIILGQEGWASYLSQDSLPFENVPVLCGMASQNAILLPDSSVDLQEFEPTYIDLESFNSEDNFVSGLFYSYDIKANVELIRYLYPETEHIALLTDNTYGGISLQAFVKKEMRHFPELDLLLLDGRKNTIYTIVEQIKQLPSNTAILIGTWRVDVNDGYFVENATYTMMKANPLIPAFTIASVGMGHWVIGGCIPKYKSQGRDLAKQAIAIMKEDGDLSAVTPEIIPNVFKFDSDKLKEFNINKNILPQDSIIENNELSILDKYKYEILMLIITVLTAFLIMVFIFLLRTKRLKDSLLDLQEDNILIMNNMQSAIKYIKPDFTVKWENQIQYPCIPQHGPDNCFLSKNPVLPYCDKCTVMRAMETKKIVDIVKDCDAWGRYIHVVAAPVLDDKQNLLGVVFKKDDVTKQKKGENELRIAKEKAEESDKLKSSFLANMSHEIRTPLNAIVGFSSLLAVTEDLEERMEYMNIINNNNDLLLQLINDILDLAKIEAGTLEFVISDVDVNSLFNEIEQSSRLKLNNPDVLLKFEDKAPLLILQTDKNRLAQVITNFLNNAMKFTEKGSITFGYKRIPDNKLYFYVKDTGCGMSEENAKEVFHRFVKLNSFVQGTGLGLSICETIVKKMEGEIGVDSVEGEGSTFWFKIPESMVVTAQYEEDKKEEKAKPAEKQPEKRTISDAPAKSEAVASPNEETMMKPPHLAEVVILVASEEDSYHQLTTDLFGECTILHANSANMAVELYLENLPKLIIMGLKHAEIDGFNATEIIRNVDMNVAIIEIIASADKEEQSKQHGASATILSPVEPEQLRKLVYSKV